MENAQTAASGKAPTHLWIVGILSLLWNCIGGYDYVMSRTGGVAYFESVGLDQAAYDWMQAMPVWASAAWAIGVWLSVIGSILLLARSRHAATAFLVSLVGALVSFAYQFLSERPASLEGGMATIMPIVIAVLVLAQWWYARWMAEKGALR